MKTEHPLLEEEIDELMTYWDEACLASAWEELDDFLVCTRVEENHVTYLVCVLTCSNWARPHLPSRPDFVKRVRAHFEAILDDPERVKSLLKGLE